MTSIGSSSLTQTETRHLVQAADRAGGLLILPEHLKPATRERLLGKFVHAGLVTRHETGDGVIHRLTAAGYCVTGRKPPRGAKHVATLTDVSASAISTTRLEASAPPADAAIDGDTGLNAAPVTKRTLFLGLLTRETGESLAEIVAATGWLPHTSRAALSRLRSTGQPLTKTTRTNGSTAYRLVPAETVALKLRRTSPAKQVDGMAMALPSSATASTGTSVGAA
jgi:hypothetical protein